MVQRNDRKTATRSVIREREGEREREKGGREGGGGVSERGRERDLVPRNHDNSNGHTQWFYEDTYSSMSTPIWQYEDTCIAV